MKSIMDEKTHVMHTHMDEMDHLKSAEDKLVEDVQERKQELVKVSRLLLEADKEANLCTKKAANISPKLQAVREKIKSLRFRVQDLAGQRDQAERDNAERGRLMKEMEERLEAIGKEEAEAEEYNRAGDREGGALIAFDAEHIAEYSRLREQSTSTTAAERTELVFQESELSGMKSRIEHVCVQEKALLAEEGECQRAIVEYEVRVRNSKETMLRCEAERVQLTAQLAEFKSRLGTSGAEIAALTEELEAVEGQLREAGDERQRNQQELKIADAVETMKVWGMLLPRFR